MIVDPETSGLTKIICNISHSFNLQFEVGIDVSKIRQRERGSKRKQTFNFNKIKIAFDHLTRVLKINYDG